MPDESLPAQPRRVAEQHGRGPTCSGGCSRPSTRSRSSVRPATARSGSRCGTSTTSPSAVIPRVAAPRWRRYADGDLLYAIKPRPTSLGVALEARRQLDRPLRRRRRRLGDRASSTTTSSRWCAASSATRRKFVARTLPTSAARNSVYRTARMERRMREADAVTATSCWLADRYGGERGTVIVQSRDTSALDPRTVDRAEARAALGIRARHDRAAVHGHPAPAQGARARCWRRSTCSDRNDLLFMTVGGDPDLAPRPDVRVLGWQPYDGWPGSSPQPMWWSWPRSRPPARGVRCRPRPTTPWPWAGRSSRLGHRRPRADRRGLRPGRAAQRRCLAGQGHRGARRQPRVPRAARCRGTAALRRAVQRRRRTPAACCGSSTRPPPGAPAQAPTSADVLLDLPAAAGPCSAAGQWRRPHPARQSARRRGALDDIVAAMRTDTPHASGTSAAP